MISSEELFLKTLHGIVLDDQFQIESMYEIGSLIGLDKKESFNISVILNDAGFIKITTQSGGIRITSKGILASRKL